MTVLGIELNDASIAAVDDKSVFYSEPGYAIARDGRAQFGWDAWKLARLHPRRVQSRFWRDLSDQPLPRAMDDYDSSADLAHDQLQRVRDAAPAQATGVVLAVPAFWTSEQLGLLLGIAQEVELPVQGLVDAAVAASRREYQGGDLLHLEVSLHDCTVTRIKQHSGAALGDRRTVEGLGVEKLERACVEFISRQFVESTRFDPLHDAVSEQHLYDNLYTWLSQLVRQKELLLTVAYRGNEFDATINLGALESALASICDPLARQVRSMLSPGVATALQVTSRLTEFPGVVAALGRLPQVAVFAQERAASARGAQRRAASIAAGESGFRLVSTLPWDQPPLQLEEAGSRTKAQDVADERPTHVLFEGRAYRLGKRPFLIGSGLGTNDYGVRLDGHMSGVSRRHCSIERRDEQLVVVDHSRYGTLLNNHAIEGSAILQAGDVLTLGNPARTFHLVQEVMPNGS